ncbi:MAG: hypothetical protein R3D84_18105 [Paracoccaceae bacterium]
MIAVVAYAVAPAIRYTAWAFRVLTAAGRGRPGHGIDPAPDPDASSWKLALPEVLLGLNQTIMFALSMLVITARSLAPATWGRRCTSH